VPPKSVIITTNASKMLLANYQNCHFVFHLKNGAFSNRNHANSSISMLEMDST